MFLAVFAIPRKFPAGADDGLPCLFYLCAGRDENVTIQLYRQTFYLILAPPISLNISLKPH